MASELVVVVASIAAVVVPMLLLTAIWVIPSERVRSVRANARSRTTAVLPFALILLAVLAFNARFRTLSQDISWWVGIEITHVIMGIEGNTVAKFQHLLGGDWPVIFFAFMYVYGYVFLLVFPLIAYYFLPSLDALKGLALAYTINYGVGFILYTVFIAFGPRNMIPELVGQSMYEFYPHLQLLTSTVNEYTNVFPSLHTSLSATVMLFAWHTRVEYRRWVPIAMFVGSCIIISTMYLAIHWIIDVLAGIVLAGFSYWISVRAIENDWVLIGRYGNATGQFTDSKR